VFRWEITFLVLLLGLVAARGRAQVFGSVRVTTRDPQNLALPGVDVTITAATSTWSQTATSNELG